MSRLGKSHEILSCTIRTPPFSYVHLRLSSTSTPPTLDELTVKSYCTSALRQFLGLTGQAISVDILLVRRTESWVRVPRADLGVFVAALTAWKGMSIEEQLCVLRVESCGDWLGAMIGRQDQEALFSV